jgi:hypothetical protein
MSRQRTFTKAEIRDAALAAAESGLCVRLHPEGGIEFTHEPTRRQSVKRTPEMALEEWLNGDQAGGRA